MAAEMVTEMVPDRYIQLLLRRPLRRPSVKSESFFQRYPDLRESCLATDAEMNMQVDLQEHMLKQYHAKGFAKVGAERYDNDLRRLFILPDDQEETVAACLE